MANNCRRHSQIFNFFDNFVVHVVEAGKTKMVQVDLGKFDPPDTRSKAERAIQENSEASRREYATGLISAKQLLSLAAHHFSISDVQREMNVPEANPEEELADNPDDPDDPQPVAEGEGGKF